MAVGTFYFASATQTVTALFSMIADGTLAPLATSFRQLLIGFAMAVAVGVPAGIFIGSSFFGEAALGMYVRRCSSPHSRPCCRS